MSVNLISVGYEKSKEYEDTFYTVSTPVFDISVKPGNQTKTQPMNYFLLYSPFLLN
ncbi:hypothetical protein HK096_001482, partial [Nowakowskiella sp. JEL0078]